MTQNPVTPFAFLASVIGMAACAVVSAQDPSPPALKVTVPPTDVTKFFNLDPFYEKYVSANGLPVVASAQVSDYALLEAAYLINHMLAGRDDIRDAIIRSKTRFVVMAYNELTTQIPEHSDLKPAKYWDKRARGLGATKIRPAVSCGEENLLRYPGDPYITESILVHEFAHTMHQMGLESIDPEFNRKLQATYDHAMKAGLWKGTYAAVNTHEYWAEGVQAWFDTNRENDPEHNHVDTREELQEYDPQLARLIEQTLRTGDWRYVRPEKRIGQAHLAGYDPAKAPKFKWPPELLKWYQEYEARRKKEARQAPADGGND
jgi:hypothetical protein